MNKIVNKFWGVLPFIMIVFCGILVTAIEKVTDNTFRILPRNILICLGIICFGVLLLWLNTRKKINIFAYSKNYISFSVCGYYLNLFVCYGVFAPSRTYRNKKWSKDGCKC